MLAAIVSALHPLALAIRLPSLFLRGRRPAKPAGRRRPAALFAAGNISGVAADLWLVTGVVRAFAGVDVTSACETIEALTGRPSVRWRRLRAGASRGWCRL